jgi:antibiotic biosynthesis monooxygenase (ABM) superfamily enzyme
MAGPNGKRASTGDEDGASGRMTNQLGDRSLSDVEHGSPVTVVVSRVIRPGKEREFEAWAREIDAATRGFAGHLGNVRLHESSGVDHLVYRFNSREQLRIWEGSEERRQLLARAEEISEEQHHTAIGMDAWFAISGQSASPKWKTFLVTWIAVYPTLVLITYALNALVPGLWWPAKLAMGSVLLTACLTWLLMPRISRMLRPWLLRGIAQVRGKP